MGTSKPMILVPLSIWSSWTQFCRAWARDFRSAALAATLLKSLRGFTEIWRLLHCHMNAPDV